MRRVWVLIVLALSAASILNAQEAAKPEAAKPEAAKPEAAKPEVGKAEPARLEFKNLKQKVSYLIGLSVARQAPPGYELDLDYVNRGVQDGFKDQPAITPEEIRQVMTDFRDEYERVHKELGERNRKASEEFLAANAKKDGVKTTASGLQYKVVTEGTGKSPDAKARVKCKYRGSLVSGKVFDSTEKHGGQPAEFPVTGVIPGWSEALQLMKEGAKWELYIPAKLAYGTDGPPEIGPEQVLIFEVELVQILPPLPAKGGPGGADLPLLGAPDGGEEK